MSEANPVRRKMLDYLGTFGLDASVISPDDWNEDGYFMRTKWEEMDAIRIPWPVGFNYGWFKEAFRVADLEDFRLAGVDRRHVIR